MRKYEKYIVEGVRPDLKLAPFRINTNDFVPGMETRLLHLDEKTLKGSFYVSCFWFWKGSEEVLVKPHVHEYDEVLGCIGTDPFIVLNTFHREDVGTIHSQIGRHLERHQTVFLFIEKRLGKG